MCFVLHIYHQQHVIYMMGLIVQHLSGLSHMFISVCDETDIILNKPVLESEYHEMPGTLVLARNLILFLWI